MEIGGCWLIYLEVTGELEASDTPSTYEALVDTLVIPYPHGELYPP